MDSALAPHRRKLIPYWNWLWLFSGGFVGSGIQSVANTAYSWLAHFFFGWPDYMQWAILYRPWSNHGIAPWHPIAGVVLGAIAANCLFLRWQGQPQVAANQAFWWGLCATMLSLSFAGFYLYAYLYLSNDWCGNSRIGAPTGIQSITAQIVGTVVFTNVSLQASLLLLFWGWRQKCALHCLKAPLVIPMAA